MTRFVGWMTLGAIWALTLRFLVLGIQQPSPLIGHSSLQNQKVAVYPDPSVAIDGQLTSLQVMRSMVIDLLAAKRTEDALKTIKRIPNHDVQELLRLDSVDWCRREFEWLREPQHDTPLISKMKQPDQAMNVELNAIENAMTTLNTRLTVRATAMIGFMAEGESTLLSHVCRISLAASETTALEKYLQDEYRNLDMRMRTLRNQIRKHYLVKTAQSITASMQSSLHKAAAMRSIASMQQGIDPNGSNKTLDAAIELGLSANWSSAEHNHFGVIITALLGAFGAACIFLAQELLKPSIQEYGKSLSIRQTVKRLAQRLRLTSKVADRFIYVSCGSPSSNNNGAPCNGNKVT